MTDAIHRLLAERAYLLADGAMGTNLFRLGLETGDSPELWNVEHPDRVAQVHREFVAAGSDLFLTNSFGGTRFRLKLHDLQDRVAELNEAAARIAREVTDAAREESGREVLVAGSMGPTGEIMAPVGALDPADAATAFAEQAQALARGGVDVLWIETMSSREEVAAAVAGAATTDVPYVCTMTFDTNRRTMMGVLPGDYARFCHELDPAPVGFGANCGVGPGELLETTLALAAAANPSDVLIAKGNCGIPVYQEGEIVYKGSPELMQEYARLALDAGARIIGGCCGTTPQHIVAMAAALAAHVKGERPDLAAVEAKLGPVWVRPDDAGDAANDDSTRRERRRRRRRA